VIGDLSDVPVEVAVAPTGAILDQRDLFGHTYDMPIHHFMDTPRQ
jgi:hypothetical protein